MVGYLKFTSTKDVSEGIWTSPEGPAHYIDHGASMVVFRGELWAAWISTAQTWKGRIYLNKFVDGKTAHWLDTNTSWRANNRVSVTTLNDLFYLAWQSTDEKIYIGITANPSDPKAWKTVGPIAKGAPNSFRTSPAIAAFDGQIHVLAGGIDARVYHTVLSAEGEQQAKWTPFDDLYTTWSPALCVHDRELYFLHVGLNNNASYTAKLSSKSASWQWKQGTYSFTNISSGPSLAVHADGKMYMTFKAPDDGVTLTVYSPEGKKWVATKPVGAYSLMSSGIASHNGRLYVSVANTGKKSIAGMTELGSESDEDDLEKEAAQRAWDGDHTAMQKSSRGGKRWYNRLLCT